MKYFKTFEGFKKDYMKKIDLKDFKKIKKGTKLMYMGGPVEVLDNNGYVLKLKGGDGRTFTVNKSQFDHGGMTMRESVNESKDIVYKKGQRIIIQLTHKGGVGKYANAMSKSKNTEEAVIKKRTKNKITGSFKYELTNGIEVYPSEIVGLAESINEGKAPDANKALKDLEKKGSEINWLDDADDDTKKIWKKAGVNTEDENTVILYSYVSHQWDDAKKILKKNNIDFKELEDPNSAGESFIVFVKESVNELKRTLVSGTMAGSIQSLEDRKYELKKDAKGATIGNFSNVTLPKGTIIYNLPGGVFADHFSLKNKYASRSSQGPQYFDKPTFKGIMIKQTPALLSYIEKNSKVLESVNEAITPAITFEFPDERRARQFDLDIENSAIGIGDQVGNKVTVTEVDTKWRSTVKKFLTKNKGKVIEESVVTEAAQIPSNIAEFAKRRGVLKDVKQIARWAEKAGKRITGGTAIGKGYDTLILDLTYQGGEIRYDTVRGTFTLNGEPVNNWKTFSKAMNESSERDGTEASDGKHKHIDHLEEDLEAMWKKAYGEKFATKYPGVAKIIRQRKIRDPREIARIWQETYGEDFKEEYPAIWDMLSK